jgi:histidine triad (HIT) family protein
MASLFSRIVNGEIPCHKIAETADYLAFLDVRPVSMGHTLCIPKQEVDYIFDLEDAALSGLMVFAKRVAVAVKKEVPCLRCGVAVIGLEVPHAHVHVIPMNSMEDFDFKHKLDVEPATLAALAARIAAQIAL